MRKVRCFGGYCRPFEQFTISNFRLLFTIDRAVMTPDYYSSARSKGLLQNFAIEYVEPELAEALKPGLDAGPLIAKPTGATPSKADLLCSVVGMLSRWSVLTSTLSDPAAGRIGSSIGLTRDKLLAWRGHGSMLYGPAKRANGVFAACRDRPDDCPHQPLNLCLNSAHNGWNVPGGAWIAFVNGTSTYITSS